MGLSSWIQKLLDRTASAKRVRSSREEFVQLYLNRLEDRRVLNASFQLDGNALLLDNFTAGESLTVQESGGGTNYQFVLNAGSNWTDNGGIGTSAGNTLTVAKSELNALVDGLRIADSDGNNPNIVFQSTNFSGLQNSLDIDGAGNVSQSVAGVLTITTASLDIDAASINLDNANNDFDTVIIHSLGDATLFEQNGFTLNTATTQGDLNIELGSGDLMLAGNINTDGTTATGDEPTGTAGMVDITANVILGTDVTIDTDAATTDGSVTISGTVNSDGTPRDLTIESGDQGIQITQAIGTGANGALDQLNINTVNGSGSIQIESIGTTGTPGATTISLGNANTSSITFQGTAYVSTGAQAYQAVSGDNLSVTGSARFESGTGANIDFSGANLIATTGNDLTITTDNGDLGFENLVVGNGGNLTLNAGTGSISATQIGDAGREFNLVDITAGTFELSQGIRTRAQGASAGDVTINATTFTLLGDVTINTTIDNGGSTADGTLTLNAPVSGNSQTLNLIVGALSTSSSITTAGLAVDVSGTANISGQISGSGGLTKNGNGTLILDNAGTANDYTGTTTINAGTLQLGIGRDEQIPDSSVVTVAASVTLDLNNQSETVAQLTGSGNVTLGGTAGNDLQVGDANDFTFDGVISGDGNLVKLGGGTMTLTGTNTYTGTTTIMAGALQVDGSLAGTVTAGLGTTLSGSGTINTAVQINGTLSPGNSPGQLTTGDLNLNNDSTFLAEIQDNNPSGATAGTDYDQVVVNGTLTIGNNVALNLSNLSSTQIEGGDIYTLIDANAISPGSEFQGLPEGSNLAGALGLGSEFTATLSYLNGDVTITITGPVTFTSPGGGVPTRLVRNNMANADPSDDVLEFYVNGVLTETALLSGVTEIFVNGDPGSSDTFTIDFSGGIFNDPGIERTLTYDGGAGSVDTLIIEGGTFQRVVHTFTGSDSGDLTYSIDDDLGTINDQATISYLNLEPVDMTGSSIGNLVFNLPGNGDMAILEDDPGAGVSRIRSQNATPTFETTTFANPTNSLTINLGNDDAAFTVADTPDLQTTLNINGQTGANDAVTFTGSLDLGAVGSLNVDVDTITMNDGTSVQTNAGTISLIGTGDIQLSRLLTNNSMVTITTTGGAITDNTALEGAGNENIVANTVSLNAATGIGSGTGLLDDPADIDINGGNLSATNTGSGAIQIFETNSIALNQVSNVGGTVVIDAGMAINDADLISETPNIVADTIRLRATTGIGASGAPTFGDNEDLDISATILYAENTTSGSIQISDNNGIALEQILNVGRTVLIDAGAGAITDADTSDDTNPNIVAGSAGLKAVTGIGDGVANDDADIDTNVDTIAATTNSGDINLDDTNGLTLGSVGGIMGLTITNSDAVMTGNDDITVFANGTLTVNSAITNNDGGDVTLKAETTNFLNVNAGITAIAPGNITLTGQDVTVTGAIVEILGTTSNIDTVQPRNGPVTGTGILTINATGITTVGAGATIRTNGSLISGSVIQITTNDLDIDPTGFITTGATNPNGDNGAVIIRNATAGRMIQLGGAGADLNIDNTELAQINTNSLRIGRLDNVANAGNIEFTGNFTAAPASITTVQLFTGGSVTQTGGSAFSADEISIFATGVDAQNRSVVLNNANNNAIRRLAVNAQGSILFLDNDSVLNIDRVDDLIDAAINDDGEDGNDGVVSASGFVDLQAMAGNLTVRNTPAAADISAGGVNDANNLAINLLASSSDAFITIDADANVSSTAGAHRYTADNMAINGTITANGQLVHLRNATNGVAIELGTAGDASAATLELSDAELDNITTNLLAIGRNSNGVTSGNITVTAAVNTANTSLLHLITAGSVSDGAAGQLTEENLAIESVGSVTFDNLNSHNVGTLAANVSGAGSNLTFRDTDGFTVGRVDRLVVTGANDQVSRGTLNGINTNGGNPAGGNVTLIAENGDIVVNQAIETTANDGGRNSGFLAISTLGIGIIDINAPLTTAGTTVGGDGQGGDITLTTANGDITIDDSLNATGGSSAVDGGNITLTAQGTDTRVNPADQADVVIAAMITTNDVANATDRGKITINAADAVSVNANMTTTGAGTVAITANTDGVAGNDSGNLTMASGTQINAQNGGVTLTTTAGDVGDITVGNIVTADGAVLIDANGTQADVLLQNTITSANGNVTVNADDTVEFQATAVICSTGTSNVIVQANADNADSNDDNDEILMRDGSLVDLNTGTILLSTQGNGGGNITIGRLVTNNAANAAVTIRSEMAVLDGGDAGTLPDIQAIGDPNSRINIVAVTGVGTGNPLETSGVRFDVNNTSVGTIAITNTVDNLAVAIDRLVTTGQAITFINDDPDNLTPGLLTIGGMGVVSASNGGLDNDITITTEGALTVAALLNTQGGTGGTFTLTGGATFTPVAAIQLGTGDINLTSGDANILINTDLTIDGGPARFFAPEDIIVSGRLETTAPNGNLLLSADNTGPANEGGANGSGGVLVRSGGQVVSTGTLTLEGSNLVADGLTTVPAGIENGVHIESDAGNPQLTAQGDLTLRNRPGLAMADIIFGGNFGSIGGNVLIDANDKIFIGDDATISGPNTVTFGDATGRDPVVDDGDATTTSNLTVNSAGTVVFFGRVGDDSSSPLSQRIDSLTTDAGGQTHIRGGFVSTHGQQFYGDNVFLHADTNLVNSTSFTTTNNAMNAQPGNVTFSGFVRGLDLDAGSNTLILDDVILNVAGTTQFNGLVGVDPLDATADSTQRIGDGTGPAITINSSGQTFFNGTVFTQSGIQQIDAAGRVTINANMFLDAGDTDSQFLADVTLNTVAIFSNGNLTFGSGNANTDELLIAGGSTLDTTGRNFADSNRFASEAGTPSVPSRNITINSRVTDPVQMILIPNEDLILNLNTGDLQINGSVGDQVANNRFGDLIIQSANDFLFGPSRTTVIFSESLQQFTGVDNGTDRATTQLSSAVNVSAPEGIRIATSDVVYDSAMQTNGQRALTEATGTIIYTNLSSLSTNGGMVVSNAVTGEINMGESAGFTATIDAGSGMVVFQAAGNLRVSQIRSVGGFVALTSLNGQIIDQGDQAGLPGSSLDIQAAQLRLAAGAGIGSGSNLGLETQVSNLVATTQTNGIAIANAGDLTIGGIPSANVATLRKNLDQPQMATPINLPPVNGLSTSSGNITVATTGSMTVNENIRNQAQAGPGDITLMAATGNFTANNTSAITTANGNLSMIVGNNFAAGLQGGQTVMTSSGGNVLVRTGGTASFGGHVGATNNGSVLVDAGGDFTLQGNNLTGAVSDEMSVQGTGQIIVVSDGTINYDVNSGAVVRSGTGAIRAVDRSPSEALIRNILTPQINTIGEAFLTFTLGFPGETNFTILVDWGEMQVERFVRDAGTHTLKHTYAGPPNPSNPGAPVQIVVAVAMDPNIHFFGNNNSVNFVGNEGSIPLQQGPVLPQRSFPEFLGDLLEPEVGFPLFLNDPSFATDINGNFLGFIQQALNPTNPFGGPFAADIDNLGIVTAFPVFPVPVSGFGAVAFVVNEDPPPFFIPGASVTPLLQPSDSGEEEPDDLDFSGSDPEEKAEEEIVVKLRVLSPSGQILYEYTIPQIYLSNPNLLWAKLPDGRYQIVIEEEGRAIPIVVRDVELKDHEVIRRFDRSRRNETESNAPEEGNSQLDAEAAVQLSANISDNPEQQMVEQPAVEPAGPDQVWENWQRPSAAKRRMPGSAEQETSDNTQAPAAVAAVAGGLALGTLSLRSSDEADSQMMRFSKRALSPAAKLRRRLRQ